MTQRTPLWETFQFDQFSIKSLIVQATEHVINHHRFELITPQTLEIMSHDLNELVGVAVQPYDSPPSYPLDFHFRFEVKKPSERLNTSNMIVQVINKDDEVVLEWEN